MSLDAPYHARLAAMLPDRGFARHFEWTQFSVWKDHFADKELLFHVILSPFCRGDDPLSGATWAACAMAVAAVAAAPAVIAWRQGFVTAWLWPILIGGGSSAVLSRLIVVRPHLLSLLIVALGVHWMWCGRYRRLVALGFVYAWSYAAPHFLIALTVLHALAAGRGAWRGVIYASAGVAAGMLIHPYFPNNVLIWWVQNASVLANAWFPPDPLIGNMTAREFLPPSAASLLTDVAAPIVGIVGGWLGAAATGRPLSARGRSGVVIGGACIALYCLSRRFVEYLGPLGVLCAAAVWTDVARQWRPTAKTGRRLRFAGIAAVVVTVAAVHVLALCAAWRELRAVRPTMSDAARWIAGHVPPSETILHCDFDQFPELFYYAPMQRYICAMDVNFMLWSNPDEAVYLEKVKAAHVPLDPGELRRRFHARYMLVPTRQQRLTYNMDVLAMPALYRDQWATLYDLESTGARAGP